MYKEYHYLRPLALFGGIIGLIQSLAWIGMSITALVAYYCHMNFANVPRTVGNLLSFVFFRVYFQGTCTADGFPVLDLTILNNVNLFQASGVHAFAWVYLFISFLWFICSILLITNVREKYIKYVNYFLYPWVAVVLALSILDLALGIIFGIDFNSINAQLESRPLSVDVFDVADLVLLSAKSAAGIMMTIAFRGWIVWIANICLVVYYFIQTFRLYDYNKKQETSGLINAGYLSNEPHPLNKRHAPIDAYGYNSRFEQPQRRRSFSGRDNIYAERPRQSQYVPPPQIRRDPSRDDDVVIRRDAQSSIAREINQRNSYNPPPQNNQRINYANEVQVPVPDYSPPPQRAQFDNRPQLRSALRNSRY